MVSSAATTHSLCHFLPNKYSYDGRRLLQSRRGTTSRATEQEERPGQLIETIKEQPDATLIQRAGGAASLLLWAAFVGYALLFSPNQTPRRDIVLIQQLVGLDNGNDAVNAIFFSIFNLLGVVPAIILALLQPSGRSKGGPPFWPFSVLSFGVGMLL